MSFNQGDVPQFGSTTVPRTARIACHGDRRLLALYSADQGCTWRPDVPRDLTTTLVPHDRVWDAVGPGVGTTLGSTSPWPNQLLVPAIGRTLVHEQVRTPNAVNDGKVWNWTAYPISAGAASETAIAEAYDPVLAQMVVYRSDRSTNKQNHCRKVSRSLNGGQTFEP